VGKYHSGMGFESSKEELNEILEIVDPDDEGWVTYERFLPVASLKLKGLPPPIPCRGGAVDVNDCL